MKKEMVRLKRLVAVLCTVTMVVGLAFPMSSYAADENLIEQEGLTTEEQILENTADMGVNSGSVSESNGNLEEDTGNPSADNGNKGEKANNIGTADNAEGISIESLDDTDKGDVDNKVKEDIFYVQDNENNDILSSSLGQEGVGNDGSRNASEREEAADVFKGNETEEVVGSGEKSVEEGTEVEDTSGITACVAQVCEKLEDGSKAEVKVGEVDLTYYLAVSFTLSEGIEVTSVLWKVGEEDKGSIGNYTVENFEDDQEWIPKYCGKYTITCSVTATDLEGKEYTAEAETKFTVDKLDPASFENRTDKNRSTADLVMYGDTVRIKLNTALTMDEGDTLALFVSSDDSEGSQPEAVPQVENTPGEFEYTFEESQRNYTFRAVWNRTFSGGEFDSEAIVINPKRYSLDGIELSVTQSDGKEINGSRYKQSEDGISVTISPQDRPLTYAILEGDVESLPDEGYAAITAGAKEADGHSVVMTGRGAEATLPAAHDGSYSFTAILVSCDDKNVTVEDLRGVEPFHVSYTVNKALTVRCKADIPSIDKESDGTTDADAGEIAKKCFELAGVTEEDDVSLVIGGKFAYDIPDIGKEIPIHWEGEGVDQPFSLTGNNQDDYYITGETPDLASVSLKGNIDPKPLSGGEPGSEYELDMTNTVFLGKTGDLRAGFGLVGTESALKIGEDVLYASGSASEGKKRLWFTKAPGTDSFPLLGVVSPENPENTRLVTYKKEDGGKEVLAAPVFTTEEGLNTVSGLYLEQAGVYYGPFRIKYEYDSTPPTLAEFTVTITDENPSANSVTIKPGDDDYEKILNKAITFKGESIVVREGKTVKLSVSMTDGAGAGVSEDSGLCHLRRDNMSIDELDKLDNNKLRFSNSVEIKSGGGRYLIYIRLRDALGNTQYMILNKPLLVDSCRPELDKKSNVSFNEDRTEARLSLTINDKFSGLYKTEVYVYDGEERIEFYGRIAATQKQKEHEQSDGLQNQQDSDKWYDLQGTGTVQTITYGNQKEETWVLSIEKSEGAAEVVHGSFLRLLVRLEDYAGNESYYVSTDTRFYGVDLQLKREEGIIGSENHQVIINAMKGKTPFAVYNNPSLSIKRKGVGNSIQRRSGDGDNTDSILRSFSGIEVEAADIPVKAMKVKFRRSEGAYQEFQSSGYSTEKHCFIYDKAIWEAPKEDDAYTLTASIPVLKTGKAITLKVMDERAGDGTIEDRSAEAEKVLVFNEKKTAATYTNSFIVDTTEPKVKYSANTNKSAEMSGATAYYFGLQKGYDTPKAAEITVEILEKNWYEYDQPDIVIYKDQKEININKEESVYKKYISVDWKHYPRQNRHIATVTIDAGKLGVKEADWHKADGQYTVFLRNSKGAETDAWSYYNYKAGNKDANVSAYNELEFTYTEDSIQNNKKETVYVIDTIRPVAVYSAEPNEEPEDKKQEVVTVKEGDDEHVYYKTEFTESLTITEVNFDKTKDPEKRLIKVRSRYKKNVMEDKPSVEVYSAYDDSISDLPDQYVYKWQRTVKEGEGVYRIVVDGTDLAGNKLRYETSGDKKALKKDSETAGEVNDQNGGIPFESTYKVLDTSVPALSPATESNRSELIFMAKNKQAELQLCVDDAVSGLYRAHAVLFDGVTDEGTSAVSQYGKPYTQAGTRVVWKAEYVDAKEGGQESGKTIRSRTDSKHWTIKRTGSYLRLFIILEDFAGNVNCYKCDYDAGSNTGRISETLNKYSYFGEAEENALKEAKNCRPFALYGNPELDISFDQKTQAISRSRQGTYGEEIDFLFTDRNALHVIVKDMPVGELDILFARAELPSNKLHIASSGYVTKSHSFGYKIQEKGTNMEETPDQEHGEYEFKASFPVAGEYDGQYSLDVFVPSLLNDCSVTINWGNEENKVHAYRGNKVAEENEEYLLKAEAAIIGGIGGTKYSETFIRDTVAPIANYSIPDTNRPSNIVGNTFYYGLEGGIGETPRIVKVEISIAENYWYEYDKPEIRIYRDGTIIESTDKEKDPIAVTDWKLVTDYKEKTKEWRASVKINPGKDHAQDGRYTFSIVNDDQVTYFNYRDGDKVGNINDGNKLKCEPVIEKVEFVIDTIRPEAVYSVDNTDVKEYKGDEYAYYREQFTEKLTVTDKNASAHLVSAISNQKSRIDDSEPATESGTRKLEPDSIEQDNTVYTYQWPRTDEAVYWLTVWGTDLAHNKLVFECGDGALNQDTVNAASTNAKGASDSHTFETKHKVLDTTAPVVTYTITEIPEKCHYNKYDFYNSSYTADFNLVEVNFRQGNLKFTGTFSADTLSGPTALNAKDTYRYRAVVEADKRHEGHHQYTISGTDKAGNEIVVNRNRGTTDSDPRTGTGSYTTGIKVVDVTAPVFVSKMTQPGSEENTDGTTAYFNTDVNVSFTVSDTNFDSDKIRTTIASATPDDYSSANPAWQPVEIGKSTVNFNGQYTYPVSVAAANNGVYRFEVKGEDAAGNALVQSFEEASKTSYNATEQHGVGEFWTYNKVIDTIAPTGHIDISNYYSADLSVGGGLQVTKSAPYRQETSASGTVSVTRDNSPVKIEYPLISSIGSLNQSGNITDYAYMAAQNFATDGQQVFRLEITLTDRAGNTTELIRTNSIYLDVEPPQEDELAPTISIVAHSNSSSHGPLNQPLFNSSVPFSIVVTDPNQPSDSGGSNGRSSGLDQVYYTISVDGAVVKTESLRNDGKMEPDQKEWDGNYNDPELFYAINTNRTADSALNNNNIVLTVYATDHSGNKSQREYAFGIDVTSPAISVTYDNNNVENERYFKADRTATIVVTDRNFDPGKISITTNGGSQSDWVFSNNGGNGDNDTWTKRITYSEDGDFKFDIQGTDLLGNRANDVIYNGAAPRDFTIDKTIPVLSITFDLDRGYNNSLYFNQTRVATVKITEHNFRASDAKVEYPGTIARGEPGSASAGSWGDSGDDHRLEVTFSEDADYVISAEYTDLAGNKAVKVTSEPFTIDKTVPEIDYDHSTVENGRAYSGAISPRVFFSDTNYTSDGIAFTMNSVKGSEKKKLELAQVVNDADGFGGSISYRNFKEVVENDDIYRAKGSIVDRAGNEKTVEFTFSVNRFGSTWDYNADAVTEKLVGAFANEEKDVFLREINVNTVAGQKVDLIHDTDFKSLIQGEDFEIKDTSSENGWKSYVYRFYAKNFSAEGKYTVVVHSKDKSGNENSNSNMKIQDGAKDVPLSFTIDKTRPYAELRDVDTKVTRYNAESLAVNASVYDNLSGVQKVEIYIYPRNVTETDGRRTTPVVTYENERKDESENLDRVIESNGGKIPFEIKEYASPQTLRIVTYDRAGNVSSTVHADGQQEKGEIMWESVLVTRNVASQVFYNRPVFFGILGMGALATVLIFLFMKRRKEKQEEGV